MKRLVVCVLLCISASVAARDAEPFQRGVCYASTWRNHGQDAYGSVTSQRTLERLRKLGVAWISLTPFGFMESATAEEVRISTHSMEGDARLHDEAAHAHALGIKVTLKPHIWIRAGEWPGSLTWKSDEAWKRWFASYRRFILHYAELAERDHDDMLVLGTELKSASACDEKCWRELIADVRRVYHGPLTYAANWDEAAHVPFWDALDYVGVDEYAPIAKTSGAHEPDLCAAWDVLARDLVALSKQTGKRIILTELGYRAARDAAMAPATWPENDGAAKYDPEHQAACFRAALKALWGKPWLAGIYVWKWFTDSHDEEGPTDFSIADKPAETVLGEFYRRDFR